MSRCRHDVLFFDSEPTRIEQARLPFSAVCNPRFATKIEELREELQTCRPDVFIYVYSWTDNSQLDKIADELNQPEFFFLPIVVVIALDQQELVIKHFEGERIHIQPRMEMNESGADMLASMLSELDELPHVCVVDDDEISRSVVIHCLEDYCTISSFDNGEEALKFLDSYKPDVMLLDINMPGMNGFDVLDRIRQKPGMKKLPVMILTGDSDRDTVVQSVERKAVGYLVKPVNREELRQRIHQILEANKPKPRVNVVLAVDDDVATLKNVQAILKGEAKIVAVNSADQAAEYCENNVPDLILLDYEMPEHNGIYLLRKLRMDERFNNCPVVMLTGNKDRATVMSCFASGAQGYLAKPVNAMSLRLRVRQHLSTIPEREEEY
ncbi:Response regulator receiver domain-containing protein [Lachnospiraceae bacterium XBB1006]|nr:Response regulator receiver domain-containing protein [Lachnospiraceae bacterium XBB1006]